MFTGYRAPVFFTTGVCPTGDQVVPGVVVRADPGLIGEVDGGALGLGRGPDRGVLLALPPIHRLGVLLIGAVQRPLRRQPQLAQQPPDVTTLKPTPNSRRITSRTISRVHSANSNCICRGSCPAISAYSRAICGPASFGGRPGTGLAFSASLPPSRYFASQP